MKGSEVINGIFITTNSTLKFIGVDVSHYPITLISKKYVSRPKFVTSNAFDGIVIWTDADNGTIFKAHIRDLQEPEVFLTNVTAEGIAFEWFQKNIYAVDSEHRDIIVCNPITCVVLYHEGENIPYSIAVDSNSK